MRIYYLHKSWRKREDSDEGSTQRPYIDYRWLAIVVAARIVPDLQETIATTIQTSLNRLQAEVQYSDRLSELEQRVSYLEDDNGALIAKIKTSAAACAKLTDKVDNLKNRSRRNNLRLVGLHETVPAAELQSM